MDYKGSSSHSFLTGNASPTTSLLFKDLFKIYFIDEIVCKNMSAYRICVGFLTPSSTVRGHPSLSTLRPFQVHSIGVIHRDIKPENMMIDNNNEIQLIDFGSSLVFESRDNDKVRGTIGTPAFLAPECVQDTGEAYSGKKADIWAVGMTLALMLTGKLPYDGLTKYDVIEAIRTKPLNIKKSELFGCINTHAIEFLTNALNRNPKERLDALQLKASTWITTHPMVAQSQRP